MTDKPCHGQGVINRQTSRWILLSCAIVIITYLLMIDLKGISTDEGIRLHIINGGQLYVYNQPSTQIDWLSVIETGSPYAYQPLYFLIQHTVMRVARTQDVVFLRLVNIFFLWVALQGLLALAQSWRLLPRLFLIGVFSFNAYLFMHVLQIREYTLGVVIYIWSTWLVLQLEARRLDRPWWDVGWFASYGAILTLGFYNQTWVVFPAIGQFIFLLAWRRKQRLRFLAHLGLSYLIVLAATLPFLLSHTNRANVGRWGIQGSDLWPQLSDGFHLVLSGHVAGHSWFTDLLCGFWLIIIATSGTLLLSRRPTPPAEGIVTESKRQGMLMLLSIALTLAFQIGYFYKVENLSVWPRYFVIHYFFLAWLLALAFRYFHALSIANSCVPWARRLLQTLVGMTFGMMILSGGYQIQSYYRDPYFDTGLSRTSNWRVWAAEISPIIEPGDLLVLHDFLHRATLTFTQPVINRTLLLTNLESSDLSATRRLVYLEYSSYMPQRQELADRMSAKGFTTMQEVRLRDGDGQKPLDLWRLLIFTRP